MKMGVPILGTAAEDVDAAEDRERFDEILETVPYPETGRTYCIYRRRGKEAANALGYPVLVRPSYVLGGQGCRSLSAMKILMNLSVSSIRSPGASDPW